MKDWDNSWYTPGNWALPLWWTSHPPVRDGAKMTYAQLDHYYNHESMRIMHGHTGGMTTPPATTKRTAG